MLLDFADKIAYVARDASMFFMRLQLLGLVVRHGVFTKIREFVDAHPRACTVWDSITVEDGRVVVEDGERLADFLMLRALLFRNVYYAPEARFLEHLLAKIVVQYLVDEGIDPDAFRVPWWSRAMAAGDVVPALPRGRTRRRETASGRGPSPRN